MVAPFFIYLTFLWIPFTGCTSKHPLPYNLDSPDKIYSLPKELNEISGIAEISENKIACITDEEGLVYIYDLESEKIIDQIPISGAGDFEDIIYHSNTYYLLESNGDITSYSNGKASLHPSSLTKSNNTEGLCIDTHNNRLLISCKVPPLNIYASNLNTLEVLDEPIGYINAEKFSPTALAFLNRDDLLVLSGNGKLGIYSMEKKTINIIPLDKKLFPQPEGILLLKNGDLLISNEGGKKGKGTILLFHKK